MPISLYDTRVLVAVIPHLLTSTMFFSSRYFGNVIESEEEEIEVDLMIGARRMAPFVSPLVQGKIVENQTYQTRTFKPAYIKDKRRFDPTRPLKRRAGERVGGGEMSPGQRERAAINETLQDQLEMVERRLEWMAVQALLGGTVTVSGEGYAPVVVDFQRDANNTVALVGAARWGEAGVSPGQDIEAWCLQVLQSSGVVVEDIVMTNDAWRLFKADTYVKDDLNTDLRGTGSSLNQGPSVKQGAQLKGFWGELAIYVHNDWYIDPDDNTEKPFLPSNTVMLLSSQIEGRRQFGSIIDPEFAYQAMAFAPKSWIEKDPAVRWMMMQSAPLMVPFRPNASFTATVR